MSVILISNVAGKIPTVSQLLTTDSGMGYNRVDGLFYALRITGNTKQVICIGASINPTDIHASCTTSIPLTTTTLSNLKTVENTLQQILKMAVLFSSLALSPRVKNTLPPMPGNLAKYHCLTTTCFYA